MVIIGVVWVVQGLGLTSSGSFMEGNPLWAVFGALMILIGLMMVLRNKRKTP